MRGLEGFGRLHASRAELSINQAIVQARAAQECLPSPDIIADAATLQSSHPPSLRDSASKLGLLRVNRYSHSWSGLGRSCVRASQAIQSSAAVRIFGPKS